MADSLQGHFSIRTIQDHGVLSFLADGSSLQIRGAFLSLLFKQDRRDEYDGGIGLLDCIEDL